MMMERKRYGKLRFDNCWGIDKVTQIIDVESLGKSADEIDKDIVSFGEMQLKQEDRSCVHASIELHLHVVHVVPSEHESDQH
ncbi:hypothetical protein Tco_0674014 [Tanacetum coccineum]